MISVIFLISTILAIPVTPIDKNACAIAAPAKPPLKVWEEEEGMPYHQVSRFQKIAAIKPANITGNVMYSLCTVLPMVLATA